MKKSLRKVIGTLAAVTALTAAMAVTASAAFDGAPTVDITESAATFNATLTGKAEGEQLTILLLYPGADTSDGVDASEIAYINQESAVKIGEKDGAPIYGVEFKNVPLDEVKLAAAITDAETKGLSTDIVAKSGTNDATADPDSADIPTKDDSNEFKAEWYGNPTFFTDGDEDIDLTDVRYALALGLGNRDDAPDSNTYKACDVVDPGGEDGVDLSDTRAILQYGLGINGTNLDTLRGVTADGN